MAVVFVVCGFNAISNGTQARARRGGEGKGIRKEERGRKVGRRKKVLKGWEMLKVA